MKLNKTRSAEAALYHTLLLVFAAACVVPIVLLLSRSLTTDQDAFQYGVRLLPVHPTWEAYRIVFAYPETIVRAYLVTIATTVIGTLLSLIVCALAAYPLSQSQFRFRNPVGFVIYFTMLFNGGLVPYYLTIRKFLHMDNTLWVLIIPLIGSPWIIFLLRTFFRYVPDALIEQARMDGGSEFRILVSIIVPLSLPGMATVALMTVLAYWNEWYHAMIFIRDERLQPLQLLLQRLVNYINELRSLQSSGQSAIVSDSDLPTQAIIAATSLVATGPMLFVFMGFQRFFVQGLTLGAVKE